MVSDRTWSPAVERSGRDDATSAVAWLGEACVIVPALDAAPTVGGVLDELRREIPELARALYVVDDGSRDATGAIAKERGAIVVSHRKRRGKGAALRSGFAAAARDGKRVALTVDADGQHPGGAARLVLLADREPSTFVLGVRDLARDGAPPANRFSNAISNFFLSRFAGRPLRDTQCGLRRYPIEATIDLGGRGDGYDLEAELVLRAVWAGHRVLERPIAVRYPADRRTHFRVARDPWRIIRTVVTTTLERRRSRR